MSYTMRLIELYWNIPCTRMKTVLSHCWCTWFITGLYKFLLFFKIYNLHKWNYAQAVSCAIKCSEGSLRTTLMRQWRKAKILAWSHYQVINYGEPISQVFLAQGQVTNSAKMFWAFLANLHLLEKCLESVNSVLPLWWHASMTSPLTIRFSSPSTKCHITGCKHTHLMLIVALSNQIRVKPLITSGKLKCRTMRYYWTTQQSLVIMAEVCWAATKVAWCFMVWFLQIK